MTNFFTFFRFAGLWFTHASISVVSRRLWPRETINGHPFMLDTSRSAVVDRLVIDFQVAKVLNNVKRSRSVEKSYIS